MTEELQYHLLNTDVAGEDYARLLDFALSFCDSFMLTVRDSIDETSTVGEVLDSLNSLLIRRSEESEWPGTKLLGGAAIVSKFQFNQHAVFALTNVSGSLFAWVEPNLPEDLSLIRKDGRPWLVTISHEKEAYFNLSNDEKEALIEHVPALKLMEHI